MIKIWKQRGSEISQSAILEKNCWIEVTGPDTLEVETLQREYNIERDFIDDILDIDERPRSERENGYEMIIFRIPIHDEKREVPYTTIPLGVILAHDVVITICSAETEILSDFRKERVKGISFSNFNHFLLLLMNRSIMYFLKYLKETNRQSSAIEKDLQKSVRNNELIRLLTIEKSLVYFTTSLRANGLLIDKLQKRNVFRQTEDITDLLEDVITENQQAIEMANVYSNILSGMMDAFASVISNNLNVVMKRLTMISIILMIPTLFASLYGMNVGLPWQNSPYAFTGIIGVSVVTAGFGIFLFTRKSMAARKKQRSLRKKGLRNTG
jgi:magnesium transporter